MEVTIGGQGESSSIQESQQDKNLSIGERLAMARQLNRWTLNDLAQKVSSTPMKLSRIERGGEPGATLAGNIAKATGFKFEFFDVNNSFTEKHFLLHHLKNVMSDLKGLE